MWNYMIDTIYGFMVPILLDKIDQGQTHRIHSKSLCNIYLSIMYSLLVTQLASDHIVLERGSSVFNFVNSICNKIVEAQRPVYGLEPHPPVFIEPMDFGHMITGGCTWVRVWGGVISATVQRWSLALAVHVVLDLFPAVHRLLGPWRWYENFMVR